MCAAGLASISPSRAHHEKKALRSRRTLLAAIGPLDEPILARSTATARRSTLMSGRRCNGRAWTPRSRLSLDQAARPEAGLLAIEKEVDRLANG